MHAAQLELHRGHFGPELRWLKAFSPEQYEKSLLAAMRGNSSSIPWA